MRYLCLTLVLSLICLSCPYRVKAETGLLTLTENRTLAAQPEPYQFTGIRIPKGKTLTILEGAIVQIATGGVISGAGSLIIRGTTERPVVITGVSWEGVVLSGAQQWYHTIIRGTTAGVELDGPLVHLESVAIQDVPRALRIISHATSTSVMLKRVWTEYVTYAGTLLEPSISLLGPFAELWLEQVRTAPSYLIPTQGVVLQVLGGFNGMHLLGGETQDGCPTVGDVTPKQSVLIRVKPGCSVQVPSLIFVPGFGTSINSDQLAQPLPPQANRKEWYFLRPLSYSYSAFLQEATARGLRYDVAYYDWRRTPADITRDYLIPLINEVKARDHTKSVYLVTHSYGGIVARSYIQSPQFQNDVAGLVLEGTPSLGSAKVYRPWEGGELSRDWQPLSMLLRYYSYIDSVQGYSQAQQIRRYFPGAGALIPIYPVLQRPSVDFPEVVTQLTNASLPFLQETQYLLRERVRFALTVAGTAQETGQFIPVGQPTFATDWPDGIPSGPNTISLRGDGTVLLRSVELPGVATMRVAGQHAALPSLSSSFVLSRLYPTSQYTPPSDLPTASRQTSHILWFTIDCPVDVLLTTPSGRHYSSASPHNEEDSAVVAHDAFTWFLVPEEKGVYTLQITARESTPVRWWEGMSEPQYFSLQKGEVRTVSYGSSQATPAGIPPLVLKTEESSSPEPPMPLGALAEKVIVPSVSFKDLPERAWSLALAGYISPARLSMLTFHKPTQPLKVRLGSLGVFLIIGGLVRRKVLRLYRRRHPP